MQFDDVSCQKPSSKKTKVDDEHIRLQENNQKRVYFEASHQFRRYSAEEKLFSSQKLLHFTTNLSKRIVLVTDDNNQTCVLKIFKIEKSHQQHIIDVFEEEDDKVAITHAFLVELKVLCRVRQLLRCKATPCFSYLYTFFFIENHKNELHLAICTDFLSNLSLEQWIINHVVNNRKLNVARRENSKRSALVSFFREQFHNLLLHIFTALHCLGNIQHNDLHLNNILMVHFREKSSQIAYIIGDRYYVAQNNLGESLCQIPIIFDFDMASSKHMKNNESFPEHYRNTQQCAYHSSNSACRRKSCNQRLFCDIVRLLNGIYDLLRGAESNDAQLIFESFQPFNDIRERLNYLQANRCDAACNSLQQLIEENFGGNLLPLPSKLTDAITYNCNVIDQKQKFT